MPAHGVDLVLVNPASRRAAYQSLSGTLAAIEPPVWAGLMATFVRNKGFEVAIIDAEAEELSSLETAELVAELDPRLTAVVVYGHQPSASTQVMPAASAVCSAIKELVPDMKVLLVGGHVAALPERTLREEQADFVCVGEGPHTLVDLLVASRTSCPDWSKVRDLGYREDREVCLTARAPLVTELDRDMPGVAWDLLPMDRYRAHNWHCLGDLPRQPYAALYTTLGCPYRCTFCCIQAPFKSGESVLGYRSATNSYRFWSPAVVVDQMEMLNQRFGVRNFKIADEMFVLNKKHVESICALLIQRRLDLNIWAYARVDTIKDGMLDKLSGAGFRWLAFGIEAASERVRSDVQKGFDQDDIFRTLRQVEQAGISVIGNYIFGLPEDDLTTMQQTLDLALALKTDFANFYCAMAYPGSALYEQAFAQDWRLPAHWSGYAQHAEDCLPLRTRYLDALEVLRFRDEAFATYYANDSYLDKVRHKFGDSAVDQIQRMAAVPLRRTLACGDDHPGHRTG